MLYFQLLKKLQQFDQSVQSLYVKHRIGLENIIENMFNSICLLECILTFKQPTSVQ